MDMVEQTAGQIERYASNRIDSRLNDHMAIILAPPFIGMSVAWANGVLHDAPANGIDFWSSREFLVAIAFLLW